MRRGEQSKVGMEASLYKDGPTPLEFTICSAFQSFGHGFDSHRPLQQNRKNTAESATLTPPSQSEIGLPGHSFAPKLRPSFFSKRAAPGDQTERDANHTNPVRRIAMARRNLSRNL